MRHLLLNAVRLQRWPVIGAPKPIEIHRNASSKPAETKSKPVAAGQNSSARYCLDLVRTNDYENFLCTLLIPQPAWRRSALAVRAFNTEVAKIASVVSDDKLGLMRLQFWHNAIKSIYANAAATPPGATPPTSPIPDHPVCHELARTVRHQRQNADTAAGPPPLHQLHFIRLIRARERPARQPFVDLAALEQYAEESTSCTLYLLAAAGGHRHTDLDHALSHLGKAQGIANMLRAQALATRASGVCVIPQRVMLEHGVSQERVLRCRADDAGVRECTFAVATAAHQHLERARNMLEKVPREARRLLLPAVAVERYLERLRRVDFHLAAGELQRRDSMLPLAYYWANFRRKY